MKRSIKTISNVLVDRKPKAIQAHIRAQALTIDGELTGNDRADDGKNHQSATGFPLQVTLGNLAVLSFVSAASLFNTVSASLADEFSGSTSTNWETDSNWVDGTAPTATDDIVLGTAGNPDPTVALSGTGFGDNLTLGNQTDATLTISGGALNLDGNTWFSNSAAAVGTMNIENGGTFSNSIAAIGLDYGSTAYLNVDGAGSTATISDLRLGWHGSGNLNITNGGSVNTVNGSIGYNSASVSFANVDGAGSQWLNAGSQLYVGRSGTGTLTISDTGYVRTSGIYLGRNSGSEGTVVVTGSGSGLESTGAITVGYFGDGTLVVSDGGTVTAGTQINLASGASASGSLVIGAERGQAAAGAGIVSAPTIAFGSGDSSIVFNHTDTSGSYQFGVDVTGDGSVFQEAGHTTLTGDYSGFTGHVYVDGGSLVTGSSLAFDPSASSLFVSLYSGGGEFSVENGAVISLDNVFSGHDYEGSVTVTDGALKVSSITAGLSAGGDGNLLISGASSSFISTSGVILGQSGKGTGVLEDGATASADTTYVAAFDGAEGNLTIDNATWDNNNIFAAGVASGSNGTVTVTGNGRLNLNSGSADANAIGLGGTGQLIISDGGIVDTSGGNNTIDLALNSGSSGTLAIGALKGETAAATGTLIANTVEFGSGDGSIVFNHTDTSGSYQFGVDVTGDGSVFHEAGHTTLTGDYSGFTGHVYVDGGSLVTGSGLAFDSSASSLFVSLYSGGGEFSVENGAVISLDNVFSGHDYEGSVTVTDGALKVSSITAGLSAGGDGNLLISGASSSFISTSGVILGQSGKGTGVLEDGATASADTTYVAAFDGAEGNLTIDNATWDNNNIFAAGVASGSNGTVTVTGNGRLNLNSGSADANAIGLGGTGQLVISDGGIVDTSGGNNTIDLALNSGSSGTLAIGALKGETAAATGTLIANTVEFGSGDGSVVFNHTDVTETYEFSAAFAPSVAGLGTIQQEAGHTTLTGATATRIGTVEVNGGTLVAANTFTANSLELGNSGTGGSFQVDDGAAVVFSLDADLGNVSGTTSTLTVRNGSLDARGMEIGKVAGATGSVNIIGASSTLTLTSSGSLWIGNEGIGTVTISDGASLSAWSTYLARQSGASGGLIVTGAGSTFNGYFDTEIGKGGTGTLLISNAGTALLDTFSIGVSGGTGTATVTGTGSMLSTITPTVAVVGDSGNGTLNIQENGQVNLAGDLTIGRATGGDGYINLTHSGAGLNVTGELKIGELGSGELNIAAGAVSSADATIGVEAGRTGSVLVSGSSSILQVDQLVIGQEGEGSLVVAEGGQVASSGSVVVAQDTGSKGTLAIGAASGESAAATGALLLTSIAFGDGDGAIVFNHTDTTGAYSFAHTIAGSGDIRHEAGNTTLTGDLSGFAGGIDVTGGTFFSEVKISLADGLTVSGENTLAQFSDLNLSAGSGATITDGAVFQATIVDTGSGSLNFGTGSSFLLEDLPSGVSSGSVTSVTGAVVFENGAILSVSAANFDSTPDLAIEGTLTVSGGAWIKVTSDDLSDADINEGTEYHIISTSAGISGTFGSEEQNEVESNFAFLEPELAYRENGLFLKLLRSKASFVDPASTPNERAVADVFGSGTLISGHDVYDEVIKLSNNEVSAAYNHLTGEVYATTVSTIQNLNQRVVQQVQSRLEALPADFELTSIQYAFNGGGEPPRNIFQSTNLWFSGFGGFAHYDETQSVAAIDTTSGGFTMGVESGLEVGATAGAAFSYSRTYLEISERTSKSRVDTFTGTLYGDAKVGVFSFKALLSGSYNQIDSSRYTAFTDMLEKLTAGYGAWSGEAYLESAYVIEIGSTSLEPFAGISAASVVTDSFTETGNTAALAVESTHQANLYSTLGMRISKSFKTENGYQWSIAGKAGWRHAFGDVVPKSTARFATGSDSFSVSGLPLERNTFIAGAEIEAAFSEAIRQSISYSGQYGPSSYDHKFRASISMSF